MKLYLVQHGNSLSKEENPECPLSDKGEQDVQRMSSHIKKINVNVERLLHSTKLRAKQTAEILAPAVSATPEEMVGLKPMDSVEEIQAKLAQWEGDTMLVGHLPFMSKMVSLLLGRNPDTPTVQYQQGSVVCLEQIENRWVIKWMLTPYLI